MKVTKLHSSLWSRSCYSVRFATRLQSRRGRGYRLSRKIKTLNNNKAVYFRNGVLMMWVLSKRTNKVFIRPSLLCYK